jgi:hypothetical protein
LELEAETAAVAARERLQKAAKAAEAARVASEEGRQKLNNKADRDREKAEVATELAIEKAELAGLEPPELEPLESDRRLSGKKSARGAELSTTSTLL